MIENNLVYPDTFIKITAREYRDLIEKCVEHKADYSRTCSENYDLRKECDNLKKELAALKKSVEGREDILTMFASIMKGGESNGK